MSDDLLRDIWRDLWSDINFLDLVNSNDINKV